MATEDDVRRVALSLPGAYEQASYGGSPSWRTKPRMFTWILEDDDALVVWVASVEDKEALLASDPGKFFTANHYDGPPSCWSTWPRSTSMNSASSSKNRGRTGHRDRWYQHGPVIETEVCRKPIPHRPP